ncbi:Phosphoribosylaminoimidazole-succinocarboxamide synthase [Candidatus Erwinia haradaeae]|uniref:Phosphoribosylaminoimidazole-succinocarboxamide synthase n=1 Tax=Candidatus Erwinia haradaeae TaxID=1922217 RepID=A0A451DC07_9GAMM|nr:phosphoribosylaminoimidazolesuccinocarboxamide synthase [Candidatus Erwinia haradaeae]VFP83944.1 Phosphoribosylaminoimidazole-succinocarboxamide synthase [Candidatus Erwinia haradaeae]
MKKKDELYRGKTKTLYRTDNPQLLVLEFRDDISALDGKRVEQFNRKGMINNKLNYFIMSILQKFGIPTQIEELISPNATVVKKLKMFPLECVVRNRAAGSLVKRLGLDEGLPLNPPIFELFLKDDLQHDPMVNTSYCKALKIIDTDSLSQIRRLTHQINQCLSHLFFEKDLILVDFKLEFGLFQNKVVLGDELSPDSTRLWDRVTFRKMDKDIYRQNQLGLIEAYENVASRLGVRLD